MTWSMVARTATAAGAVMIGVGMMAGCASDQVTAPPVRSAATKAPPARSGSRTTGDSLTVAVGTRWITPLPQDVSVTKIIGPAGGTVSISALKVTLSFAPQAVAQNTTITMTVSKGSVVAYGFEPHGTVFHAPVRLTQDLHNTDAFNKPAEETTMFGGYLPGGFSDIGSDGSAVTSEQNTAVTMTEIVNGAKKLKATSFTIPHFSGYILAGGRKRTTD